MKFTMQNYMDLVLVLTQKEMKVRYRNSYLGYLWSVAHPFAFAFVFFIAFKVVMRIQMEDYSLFLIAGLFPWQWFANSVTVSPMVFIANASIIKKVNFPRHIIPFSMVLQDMMHFVLAVPVIVVFMLAYHKPPSLSWLYCVPLLLAAQFMITYGISMAFASINLFFRDLERLASIGITLLFYFTPVVYPESMVPEQYRFYVNFNPLAPLMVSWRNLFLKGELRVETLGLCFFYGAVFLLCGKWIYKKLSWRFAEIL